jgi:hypothetical protein
MYRLFAFYRNASTYIVYALDIEDAYHELHLFLEDNRDRDQDDATDFCIEPLNGLYEGDKGIVWKSWE